MVFWGTSSASRYTLCVIYTTLSSFDYYRYAFVFKFGDVSVTTLSMYALIYPSLYQSEYIEYFDASL